MTQDLVSVRGLVDSDFDLPVREFDGVFGGHERVPASGYEGWRVNLNYKEVDNIVAVSPYNLPTIVLNLPMGNKHKSTWGYFGDSLAALIAPDEDIQDCNGRAMHLVFCDGLDGRPQPKPIWNKDADKSVYPNGEMPTPVWIVTAVEGVSAGATAASGQSAPDWAEENLVGKTRAEFNKWAYSDPKIRKDTALQRSITDKSFINSLMQLGRIEENEDGLFQVPV